MQLSVEAGGVVKHVVAAAAIDAPLPQEGDTVTVRLVSPLCGPPAGPLSRGPVAPVRAAAANPIVQSSSPAPRSASPWPAAKSSWYDRTMV